MRPVMKMTVTALSVLMLVAVYTASAAAPPPKSGGGEVARVFHEKVERDACYLLCVNGYLCLCNLSDADQRVNCCVNYCASKCGGGNECGDVPKKPNCPPK
ncbi:hypothetical protein ACP275_02G163500 [Erythranthe tilingii]